MKLVLTCPDLHIAIAFREWLGGEKAIYEYCHQVAMDGAKRLAEVLGTRVIDESGDLTTTMVSHLDCLKYVSTCWKWLTQPPTTVQRSAAPTHEGREADHSRDLLGG